MSKKSNVVAMVRSLWNQETGAVISAELVLVMTIAVLAMLVGLDSLSDSVNQELHDVAGAIGALSQSFNFHGMESCSACVSGSSFHDSEDDCDCVPLDSNVGHVRTPEKCEQGGSW